MSSTEKTMEEGKYGREKKALAAVISCSPSKHCWLCSKCSNALSALSLLSGWEKIFDEYIEYSEFCWNRAGLAQHIQPRALWLGRFGENPLGEMFLGTRSSWGLVQEESLVEKSQGWSLVGRILLKLSDHHSNAEIPELFSVRVFGRFFSRVVRGHYLGEGSLFGRRKIAAWGFLWALHALGRRMSCFPRAPWQPLCVLLGKLSLWFDFQEKSPTLLFPGAQNPQLAGGAGGAALVFLKHRVL